MFQLPYSVPKLLVWAIALFIGFLIYQDYTLGGHEWKQGDWLINNVNGAVRRGIMGSAILWFSGVTSLDPILVITTLQGLLFGLCIILLSSAIERSNCRHTLWLLVLSPAFFVNFWAVDPDGALRKELIIYLAFSVLLYATTRGFLSKTLLVLSALIFGVGVLGHEGNVFFAPFFLLCYFLIFQKGQIAVPLLIVLGAIILTACLVTMALAVSFSNVDDHMVVCQPILDAGVQASICDGAIKVLELRLSFFLESTFWMLASPKILSFLLMYCFAAVSILLIGFHLFDKKPMFWAAVGSAFFFLPLYVVAVDWGRWLSFHATAVIFTMLIVLSLNNRKWSEIPELPRRYFIALTIFSVIWGCTHFVSIKWGGILFKTLAALS